MKTGAYSIHFDMNLKKLVSWEKKDFILKHVRKVFSRYLYELHSSNWIFFLLSTINLSLQIFI